MTVKPSTASASGAETPVADYSAGTVEQDELDLVRRARARDRDAFGVLYDRYAARIYRFTRAWGGADEARAEDLTAQTFLRAWSGLPNLRDERVFASWLFRIARNVILSATREAETVDLEQVDGAAGRTGADPAEAVERMTDVEAVRDALRRLPEAQRALLVLRFMEGFSHRETAEILGKSEAAVRVAQFRALSKLKALLVEARVV